MTTKTKDGREILEDVHGRVRSEVRVYVAVHLGYYGTGLTASAAEAAFKAAGGKVKGLRAEGRMVLLPPGVTHFGIDGMGSVFWDGPRTPGTNLLRGLDGWVTP